MTTELNIEKLQKSIEVNKFKNDQFRDLVVRNVSEMLITQSCHGVDTIQVEPLSKTESDYFKEKGLIVENIGFWKGKQFYQLNTIIMIPKKN